jgi:hypothetical protein
MNTTVNMFEILCGFQLHSSFNHKDPTKPPAVPVLDSWNSTLASLDLISLKNQLKELNSSLAAQQNETVFEQVKDQVNSLSALVDILQSKNPQITLDQVAFAKENIANVKKEYEDLWKQIGKVFRSKNF